VLQPRRTFECVKVGARIEGEADVKTLLLWCVLLVLCWPVAILALVLWPLIWLLSIPFRLIGISFDAIFALLRAILFLPARILGHRDNTVRPL
jgi:hypothetical protein